MLITAIEAQRKNPKRFSVFIDGSFAFGIDGVDLLYYKLTEGMELDSEKYREIVDGVVYANAKDYAMQYIGYQQRSERELRSKLSERGYAEETIERVMEMLGRYGLVNDAKFAADYVRECMNYKRYGRIRIRYELRHKGVPDEYINAALDGTEEQELENAVLLLDKKAGDPREMDYAEKRRVMGYLERRGFDYSTVKDAFDALKERYDTEEDE